MAASFTSTKPGLVILADGSFVFGTGGHATLFDDLWTDAGTAAEYTFVTPYAGYLAVVATVAGLEADIGASLAQAASTWPSTFIAAGVTVVLRVVGSDLLAGAAVSAKVQFYGAKQFSNTAPSAITLA